jgi:hypothetical protein
LPSESISHEYNYFITFKTVSFRYDRDTSVFTPPKGAPMSVHATSLMPTNDVIMMLLEKYKVESDQQEFALYVLRENGGEFHGNFQKL